MMSAGYITELVNFLVVLYPRLRLLLYCW